MWVQMANLANIGLDFGPGVFDFVLQQGIIHHLLQLVPDGVPQVTRSPGVCQVVVPAGKYHSGKREQLVVTHKTTVTFALHS